MQLTDYHFELPEELIAQVPSERREDSRLLVLSRDPEAISDHQFVDFPGLLQPGDLLVFNNTRVLKARLVGKKDSGGKVEVMVDRILSPHRCLAQVRASKSPKPQTLIHISDVSLTVTGRQDSLFEISCPDIPIVDLLERHGDVPLPPYIKRPTEDTDDSRYQTVYASKPGAVAAPTAGLHFGENMLAKLRGAGVQLGYLTLHVGSGTFQPVRVDVIEEHKMHAEWCQVSSGLVEQIHATRAAGGRVIAVGTTSLRALESAVVDGQVQPFEGETDIFIYPGVDVVSCDGLVTNFHLPQSTLLMLVSALAGREAILAAYRHAVDEKYRFFSYGDAMFIR
ncbi:MAG: tRNA preQ1(34) S-adenosylmethionine ribosyltransferase-isomerase QueA [Lysobacterales bacterium]